MAWITFIGYASIQSFIFSFILFFHKKGNRFSNRILAGILFIFGIILLDDWADHTYGYDAFPHLIFMESPLWYLLAPLFFIYLKSHISPPYKFNWVNLFHLIPFLFISYNVFCFQMLSAPIKIGYIQKFIQGEFITNGHSVNLLIYWAQMSIYMLWMSILFFRYYKKLKSTNQNISLFAFWPKQVVVIIGAFGLLAGLTYIVPNWAQEYRYLLNILYVILPASMVSIVFYILIKKPNFILSQKQPILNTISSEYIPAEPNLPFSDLHQLMVKEKPFLNPEYNIHHLAKSLNMSRHKTSNLIKGKTNLNFREFVNQYRIEEAKRYLADPSKQHFTIHTIAEEVGFSSYVTFYRVFKKKEGLTPKAYLLQVQQL